MRWLRSFLVAAWAVGLAASLTAQPTGKTVGRFRAWVPQLDTKPKKFEFPILLTPETEAWLQGLWDRSHLPAWMATFEVEWDPVAGRSSWPFLNVREAADEPAWRLFKDAPKLYEEFVDLPPGRRVRLWYRTPEMFGPPPISQGLGLVGLEFGGFRLDGTMGFDGWVSEDGQWWSGDVVLGGAAVSEPTAVGLATVCLALAVRRRRRR